MSAEILTNTLKKTQFFLIAIAASLVSINLTLAWRSDNSDLFSVSLLFWPTVGYLIWEKRDRLSLKSDPISTLFGIFLISLLLIKSVNTLDYEIFHRIFPILSILAVGCLASGMRGIQQYWQELVLFGFLAFPWEGIYLFIDLSLITAKFTTFLLWLLGFEVTRQGVLISLPTGAIEVYQGCSGLKMILQLLGIALIFSFTLATTLKQKLLLPIVAILLGFIINGIRTALMAVLVSLYDDNSVFDYWHTGTGSLLFSAIAVLLLTLCLFYLESKDISTLSRN